MSVTLMGQQNLIIRNKKNTIWAALLIAAVCAGATAKPVEETTGAPRDWTKPGRDTFSIEPFARTYDERKAAYINFCAANSRGSLYGAVCEAALGKTNTMTDAAIDGAFKRLKEREDCADFVSSRLTLVWYKNLELHFMTPAQEEKVRRAFLDFKYWVDEPGPDKMISWTENHQILFHSTEYLAGQAFPDETFTNNGKTGAWHKEHARKMILKWIDMHARWGFVEWDSNVYYNEDIGAIANLAAFARDPEIATRAKMILDLILVDIGSDIFHGVYGTSHGRTYYDAIVTGREESVASAIKLVWGYGIFNDKDSQSATPIALSGYTPSPAIIALGQSENMPEFTNMERHGIPLDKIKHYGFSFTNFDDIPILWGMGIYSQPEIVDSTLKFADERNLWSHPFFDSAESIRNIPRSGSLGKTLRAMPPIEPYRTILGEVNKITFRTPDYQLSTAQNYRPGEMGNQHHIWQATLSPDAVVFVTNPGILKDDHERTPTYWAGQNRLPRTAQYKNVLVSLYNIKQQKALGERELYLFTHALFPKKFFDRVEESDGWIFGQVNDGYIALYSQQSYKWATEGLWANSDIIADGAKNVWICVMGRKLTDGTFDEFMRKVKSAKLSIKNLDVEFDAPGTGEIKFGWTGPLTVNGKEVSIDNYPLFKNPFVTSEFDSGVMTVEGGGSKLTLDFNKGEFKEEKIN